MRSLIEFPWVLLALASSCSAGVEGSRTVDAAEERDAGADEISSSRDLDREFQNSAPVISWDLLGRFPLNDAGQSTLVEVPFEDDLRYLAIRVTPTADVVSDRLCLRLEPVGLASGAVLVGEAHAQGNDNPVCTACSQRVFSGHGVGLFVFPNDGAPLPGPETLEFRVQARDCMTGIVATRSLLPNLPAEVEVEVASAPQPKTQARTLDVRVAVIPGAEVEPATWSTAWALAEARFAETGIELRLHEVVSPAGDAFQKVEVGAGDQAMLDQVFADSLGLFTEDSSTAPFLPMILVPCLEEMDPVTRGRNFPAGFCPRIPGGAARGGFASAVFVATADCLTDFGSLEPRPWTTGEELGLIIAHEIGHYLGLYHSDTISSDHRRSAEWPNIMDSGVLTLDPKSAGWSPAQSDVMRRHLEVRTGD